MRSTHLALFAACCTAQPVGRLSLSHSLDVAFTCVSSALNDDSFPTVSLNWLAWSCLCGHCYRFNTYVDALLCLQVVYEHDEDVSSHLALLCHICLLLADHEEHLVAVAAQQLLVNCLYSLSHHHKDLMQEEHKQADTTQVGCTSHAALLFCLAVLLCFWALLSVTTGWEALAPCYVQAGPHTSVPAVTFARPSGSQGAFRNTLLRLICYLC